MKGLSLREAAKTAIGLGLKPSLDGTGTLSRQDPPAGAVLPKGSNIKLFFEPPT
jgi:cell division protein FtsI (penicillin-binding protein 3)